MKEIDDTDPPKSESEVNLEVLIDVMASLTAQIGELAIRIANLETQRTPQDENDDAEWY